MREALPCAGVEGGEVGVMRKTLVLCDICGKENATEICFVVGHHSDPSGNGTETDDESIDLCRDCLAAQCSKFIDQLNESQRSLLAQSVKKYKRLWPTAS